MAIFQNQKGKSSDLNPDDLDLLNQIEQNVRGKGDTREDALKEAEQRRIEMERLNNSLSSGTPTPTKSTSLKAKAAPVDDSLRNDPRYKAYFDRLRHDKTPAGGTATSTAGDGSRNSQAPASVGVKPGTILRLDDGSLAVYKDAVSGKDYALLYFLEPDGRLVPRGIFLQNYGFEPVGQIEAELVPSFFQSSRWNRDLIVYHLNRFELVALLDRISPHEERQSPVSPSANPTPATGGSGSTNPAPSRPPTPVRASTPTPPRQDSMERGRCIAINFGGKRWEAVYWTSDEQGPIVAHNTHGVWSLMHLDLARFQDGLETGGVVPLEELKQIESSLARQ